MVVYCIRVVAPFHLSEVYAYPVKTNGYLPFLYYLSPVIILFGGYLICKLKVLKPEIIFGLGFFFIAIILTQLILLEDGYLANRYSYLPYIGLYFIIAKGYEFFLLRSHKMKMYLSAVIILMLIGFGFQSSQRSLVWKSTLSLFDHTVNASPDAAFAYNNRGIARYGGDDMEGAKSDYSMAILLNPKYSGAYYNRGIVFNQEKEYEKARLDYTKAIELNPSFASSYAARGLLEMEAMGNDTLALRDYNKAIELNARFGMAYYNRGILKLRMNDVTAACQDFWKVRNLGYSQADELIAHYCN
jgi:tetratricopeptide (TPR) repeat protein